MLNASIDYAIRRILGVPSIDALMMKARLTYLGRIIRDNPVDLMSVLHTRPNDIVLP